MPVPVLALDGAFFPLGINIAATRRGTCPRQALSRDPGRRAKKVAPGGQLDSGKAAPIRALWLCFVPLRSTSHSHSDASGTAQKPYRARFGTGLKENREVHCIFILAEFDMLSEATHERNGGVVSG